jgi:hypothetical protein
MGVVIGFVWLVIGYVLMQTSIQVWAALMLPNPVERAQQRIQRRPYASFFIGLAFGVAGAVIASFFLRAAGPWTLIGYALMAPVFASGVVGGGAFTRILAERIKPHQKNESGITALVGGAFLTTAATLLPVIGWFMFLPLIGFMSIGAGLMGIVSKRRIVQEAAGVGNAHLPEAPAMWSGYPTATAPAVWAGYPDPRETRGERAEVSA